MPSSLPLGKSLSVLGENEVNKQTHADPKGERQRGEGRKSLDIWGPVIPDDGLDFPITRVIKFSFYLSYFRLVQSLATETVLIKTDLYLIHKITLQRD